MRIVADDAIPFISQVFDSEFELVLLNQREITRDNLNKSEILIVRSVTRVNEQLLEGTDIKVVATPTSGVDHIDLPYLNSAGIHFINTPGCNARSVAEYILSSLCLLSEKNIIVLSEVTVGIIGCGHVGTSVSSLLNAVGIRHLLYDPPLQEAGDQRAFSIIEEMQSADVITLHVPLNEEGKYPTRHLVNQQFLSGLKSQVAIINAARGGVIDEPALIEFLNNNNNSHVILDVWNNEPNINRLLLSKAMVATPHIAGYSLDAKYNGIRQVYEKLCELNGFNINLPSHYILPGARTNQFIIPDEMKDDELIQFAVLSGYDIRADSDRFKGMISNHERVSGQYFNDFRKTYPPRREFTHYSIDLPGSRDNCKRQLEGLGFKVKFSDLIL
jgi:erythronate-4-phosphate dehydrogenase